MTDKEKTQTQVEQLHVELNKIIPDTWKWNSDNKGFFYIERKTERKRYGIIKNCIHCSREFLCRNGWIKDVHSCSTVCNFLLRKKQVVIPCAWCKVETSRSASRAKRSKHGYYFCGRKCKEAAQSPGGIEEIQPAHYKDGTSKYSQRAFHHYGEKCCDCNLSFKPLLCVHHVDGDRQNNDLNNLEVVCSLHHDLRHMMFDESSKSWKFNTRALTPREKLKELNEMLALK